MNDLNTARSLFAPPDSFTYRYNIHDVVRIQREAEQLRAETIARQMATVGRAVWRIAKWVGRAVPGFFALLARAVSARDTYDALSRLSDRQLEDIGLKREDIAARVIEILGGTDKLSQRAETELYAVTGGKSAKPRHEAPKRRAA